MAKVGRIQWMILGLMAMGFVIFGRFFIVNLYAGEGYANAYGAALFLVLPVLIPLIQNTGIEVQRALNRHQFRSAIYFAMAVVNALVSIPLARRFGCVGSAMGTAISLVLANGLIMNVFYHRALKIDMLYFWKEIGKTLPGFVIPLLTGALIMRYITFTSLTQYLLCVAAFAVVYCLSVYRFSCNREEKAQVVSLMGRGRNA